MPVVLVQRGLVKEGNLKQALRAEIADAHGFEGWAWKVTVK